MIFSKLKLLILRRWWELWKKSIAIKQGYRMNLFFVVFCLIVLLTNRSRWIDWFTVDASLHVSLNFLIILYGRKRTLNWAPFLCFSQLFSIVQLWNYTKTIIRLRLGEYCRIIPSTSSRGLFDNIHLALNMKQSYLGQFAAQTIETC